MQIHHNAVILLCTQIQASKKPEDAKMRKLLYSFFSADSSAISQEVMCIYC